MKKDGGLYSSVLALSLMLIKLTIYGRFTEIIKGEQNLPLYKVLKKHFWNYIIFSFIVIVPSLIFSFISFFKTKEIATSGFFIISAITTSLMIYVLFKSFYMLMLYFHKTI